MINRNNIRCIALGVMILAVFMSSAMLVMAQDDHQAKDKASEAKIDNHDHPAEEGHKGKDKHDHGFKWLSFIGKSLNSIILFGGLFLLLKKPIVKLLTQKSLEVKTDIMQREEELTKSSQQRQDILKRLERIEEEVNQIKLSAEKSGQEERNRLEELGKKEAERILEITENEINTRIENSIRNLKTKIADLTIDHFKEDIQKHLDKKTHTKIIEKNIQRCGEIIERE